MELAHGLIKLLGDYTVMLVSFLIIMEKKCNILHVVILSF